jgi:hypothetical protein
LSAWWRTEQGGVSLRVKAQPRARRPGLHGLAPGPDGPLLRVAVTEAAEVGRANRAVCETLARALGIAPSAVAVAQGTTARQKTIHITGDPAALGAALEALA